MLPGYELGIAGSESRLSGCDGTLEMSEEQVCREARNSAGTLARHVIAVKRTWALHYTWLPSKRACVHDGGMGRDDLHALFVAAVAAPATVLSLHVPTEDGIAEDVTVQFVAGSWREKLLQSRGAAGTVYALSFALVEV